MDKQRINDIKSSFFIVYFSIGVYFDKHCVCNIF